MVTAFLTSSGFAQESLAANSVGGIVRILDQDGNEVTDRSNVVVFIDGLSHAATANTKLESRQVSHKGRQFSPTVLPLVKGSTIDFFNDDGIFHNVFSLSAAKTFDLGIYPQGTSKLVTFPTAGLVKIYCNIHPRMTSTILVLNNSLFSTTAHDGSFRIDNIPDGEVTLRVWSEFGGEQHRTISVYGGALFEESFDVQITKTYVQHKNKFGQRYREKY